GAFFLPATLTMRGGSTEGLPMTDDNDAKARETAHGLIQSYIGQDHKVIDMKAFDLHKRHVQRIDGG
ncbi:MAG: hypothetical protein WBV18_02130, partial [Methyloceanibacter sp.]|uniref:hypothetical protein n=1 Tax=Methyloceanibacter sp. TaxID=1965321 RepID=UPI003C42AFCB